MSIFKFLAINDHLFCSLFACCYTIGEEAFSNVSRLDDKNTALILYAYFPTYQNGQHEEIRIKKNDVE